VRAKIVLLMLSAVPSLVWGQGKLRFDYEKEGERFMNHCRKYLITSLCLTTTKTRQFVGEDVIMVAISITL